MQIVDFRRQCAARVLSVLLMLALCTIVACSGHAPTRPVVPRHAVNTPTVPEHSGLSERRSEAQAKRDLAKNSRDSLSASEAGYYLDVLQGRLLQVLGADTPLARTPERIGINLAQRVKFDDSNLRLSPAGCRALQSLAQALVEFRKTLIVVKVGVDGTGRAAEMLAERRSRGIADCLANYGVPTRRIVIVSGQFAGNASTTNQAGDTLELDVELVLREAKGDS